MDLCYFKDQICDELDGAIQYIKNGLEIKPMSTTWANNFVAMSAAELEHANKLFNMFQEYHKKLVESYGDKMPEYLTNMINEIIDLYTEKSAKVKYMHSMLK